MTHVLRGLHARALSRSRTLAGAAVVTLLSVTAACGGSALDPAYVQAANNAVSGVNGSSGTAAGTSPQVGTGDSPDGGSGSDPGSSPTATGGPSAGETGGTGVVGESKGSGSPSGHAKPEVKAASCDGFKNSTGVTNDTITIGNASDISGPLPGLFTAAQQATKAYVAYFNASHPNGICGRKLALNAYDTRTDAGANQQAYTKMCEEVFASVGSMSAFDSGAGPTAQGCGLPALHAAATTSAFNQCSTCFGVDATGLGEFTNEAYDFWVRNNKAATQAAAMLYLNAGAAAENAQTQKAVGAKRGINWVYTAAIDVAEFNYGPYVQQLKSKGVKMVQFIGGWQQAARLLQAEQSAGYKADVSMFDPAVYEPGFLSTAGTAAEGIYMYLVNVPLDSDQPELALYERWLHQVSPGAAPTFFGLFAWSAAKLFAETSLSLGGALNRTTLVDAFRKVNGWTANGLHAPMFVGTKHPPSCLRYMVVKSGRFVPYGGATYVCNGYSRG